MANLGDEPLDVLVRRILSEELGIISSGDVNRFTHPSINLGVGGAAPGGALLTAEDGEFLSNLTVLGNLSIGAQNLKPTQALAMGSGAGDYSTASTIFVVVDGTNLAVTITPPAGILVRVIATGLLSSATGAAQVQLSLFRDGVSQHAMFGTPAALGVYIPASVTLLDAFTGDGSAHTWDLRFKTGNASDAAIVQNSAVADSPRILVVTS